MGRGFRLVVASNTRGPRFESSHWQTFIWNICLLPLWSKLKKIRFTVILLTRANVYSSLFKNGKKLRVIWGKISVNRSVKSVFFVKKFYFLLEGFTENTSVRPPTHRWEGSRPPELQLYNSNSQISEASMAPFYLVSFIHISKAFFQAFIFEPKMVLVTKNITQKLRSSTIQVILETKIKTLTRIGGHWGFHPLF